MVKAPKSEREAGLRGKRGITEVLGK